MIAAAAPGGNPDVLARMLAAKLSESLGRAFVVENVAGAGGVVAAEIVARSAADGHVLMLGDSGALAINVALNPRLTYHPLGGKRLGAPPHHGGVRFARGDRLAARTL
jgi:tripartite-type tricarboxylate transporter receptor subunit TctC